MIDVEKVERLTNKIIDKVNEHLLQESMTCPEVVLALQTVASKVIQAHEESEEEMKERARETIAV